MLRYLPLPCIQAVQAVQALLYFLCLAGLAQDRSEHKRSFANFALSVMKLRNSWHSTKGWQSSTM